MKKISKDKALELLNKSIDEGENLAKEDSVWSYWEIWIRNLYKRLDAIFEPDSEQHGEIIPLLKKLKSSPTYDVRNKVFKVNIKPLLLSFKLEIEDLWPERINLEPHKQNNIKNKAKEISIIPENQKVFVVHGHDLGLMQEVARFLEHLDLEPIILHEQTSEGLTIVEKLEKHSNVKFAVILLTPDDVRSSAEKANFRQCARQNVILELGYFMGRLKRKNTCALYVEGVEIPTDYLGVVYIQLDKKGAWKLELARELNATGLDIDMNKALKSSTWY